jgi:hypothetical protein
MEGIESGEKIFEEKKYLGAQNGYDFFSYRRGDKLYFLTRNGRRELLDADFDDGGGNCPDSKNKDIIRAHIKLMKSSGVNEVVWVGSYISDEAREMGIDRLTQLEEAKKVFQQFDSSPIKDEKEIMENERELVRTIRNLIGKERYADADALCRAIGRNIKDYLPKDLY